ncbi:hypothetical protein CAPTEDRAFT_221766 [Capitella teleta]|uniref:Vinculin n=1 Tax=Capitella teleta TaxID=283909 RepID=R7UJS7_CAPTE|nr:hypothetical protein CAPTEDRAFT_221766 [Capitella teleta]|eukprot:ELU06809.1 hypothetical protein CAPTEDRAFT_221766 [Capitella teleta]
MPVFHTKTIESILEPVAQQVSRLVILHEEAEDGNAMPDLARPVQAVKLAVDNLVRVGYETINSSEDAILKQDMPPALNRVEEASILLIQASDMLRSDPFSAPARKKLIEGSRGILQGTSALLLAFDESEVRKIIRICKNVLEYLAITEVVETMEDLVTFVKNLSPVLTKMTKEVDGRQKELTHQVHREWLERSLEQVKQLTPILISGIKIYITTKSQGGQGVAEAQTNRDYVIGKVCNEIHEMIRVLQLTTYDEEEWDADDITVIKKAQNAIEGKLKQAQDWLQDPNALVGGSGERALRQILEDAIKIADHCSNPADRDAIHKAVSDVQSMADALAELRVQGKGNSPQAVSLARGIQQQLQDLANKCGRAVAATERSGLRKPAHTVAGKVEQAQRWLANPAMDDKGLGEEAIRLVIAEGRQIAQGLPDPQRSEMFRLCDETEMLTQQLSDLCRSGMGNSSQARAVAANLSQKLHQVKNKMQEALVKQVADDFIDIGTPLKQLSDAAQQQFGVPNRQGIFEDKANRFDMHARRLADTASRIATAGGCRDRNTIEGIQSHAALIDDLTPQLVKAGRILLTSPTNPASLEHFDLLRKQWMENAEKLRMLVDDATDTVAFLKAQEEGILRDTERTEQSVKELDPQGVVLNTSNIARRANRVLQVVQHEADNNEDPKFVDRVNSSIQQLRATITPMVQNAKGVAQNPRDPNAGSRWRNTNQQLIDAVGDVRRAVCPMEQDNYPPPPVDFPPPPPDLSQLSIHDNAPPRPPLPSDRAPPRPPPPETDDEDETSFPVPQANQPIMMAAHALHTDVMQWSSHDNEIIAAAKRMALLMAKLSMLVRGEGGTKKDLIDTAKAIAEASEEVTRLAKELAREVTDRRMRTCLLQVCERIPTIGTQLKILSTVKATMLGAQEAIPSPDGSEIACGSEEDQEATEMLVGNAQNLMQSVRETVRAAEAASIKIRTDSGCSLRWVRKRPWYS